MGYLTRTDTFATQPLPVRLRENHEKGGRKFVRAKGPGRLL